MWFLTLEDIVPNFLISIKTLDGGSEALIDDAIRYGRVVANDLCKKGFFTKVKVNYGLIDCFDQQYQDYFMKFLYCDTFGYQIVDGVSLVDIKSIFRNSLPLEVIDSMSNEEVVRDTILSRNIIEKDKLRVLKKR